MNVAAPEVPATRCAASQRVFVIDLVRGLAVRALRPLPVWFRRAVRYLSVHVTTLYVMQWTLICWAMGVVGFHALDPWQVLAMIPVMIAATLAAELGWRHLWAGLRQRHSWWAGRGRPQAQAADVPGVGFAVLAVEPVTKPQGSTASPDL